MSDCGVRVICRFRPVNQREISEGLDMDAVRRILSFPDESSIQLAAWNNRAGQLFQFDRVFWDPTTTQEEVYELAARDSIDNLIKGFNATIFAYGQTGAGKSFTMFGPDISTPKDKGIIPRSCAHIFRHIANDTEGTEFTIKCSFLEIYKEVINDLLDPNNKNLKVRETPSRGVWVDGLTEQYVTCEEDVLDLIRQGEKCRAVACTNMNATSSRSHSLFILKLHQKSTDGSTKEGKLNLADLAGSEKVGKTGASGDTLEEAKKINQSLSALGNCINALTKGGGGKKAHVPYRDSKLTFILRESLGGNCKTTLLIACSPHIFNLEETISTLMFGKRAKTIKNKVSVNKQRSVAELMAIIERLKKELAYYQRYSTALEKALQEHLGPDWKSKVQLPTQDALSKPQKSTEDSASADGGDNDENESSSSVASPIASPRTSPSPEDDGGEPSTPMSPMTPYHDSSSSTPNLETTPMRAHPRARPATASQSKASFNVNASVALVELQVEMDKLQEKHKLAIDDLKDELASMAEERSNANKRAEELNKEITELQEELKSSTSHIAAQQDEIGKLKSKNEYEAKQYAVELETKEQELLMERQNGESVREKLRSLQEEQDAVRLRLEQLSLDHERVSREKQESEQAKSRFEEKNTELQSQIEVMEAKTSEMRSQQLELSLRQKKVSQQLDEVTAELQSSQQLNKDLDGRLRTKILSERQLQEKLEVVEEQVIALLKELDDTKAELRRSKEVHNELQREGEKSLMELREHTVPAEEHDNAIIEAKQLRAEAETTKALVRELKSKILTIESEMESALSINKESTDRLIKDYQQQLGERDDSIEMLKAQLNEKEEESTKKVQHLDTQIAELNASVASEKQKRKQAESELDELKHQLLDRKQRAEQIESDLREREQEVARLKEAASLHAKSMAMQNERLNELESSYERLKEERTQLQLDFDAALKANADNARRFEQQLDGMQQQMERRLERQQSLQNLSTPPTIRGGARGNVRVPVSAANQQQRSPFMQFFLGPSLPILSELQNTVKYGFLMKRSQWLRRWDKRWVMLQENTIFYFENFHQAARASGDIDISECKVAISDEFTGREFTFGIFHPKRSDVFLQASSEEERKEWMEAIRKRINELAAGGGQEMAAVSPRS